MTSNTNTNDNTNGNGDIIGNIGNNIDSQSAHALDASTTPPTSTAAAAVTVIDGHDNACNNDNEAQTSANTNLLNALIDDVIFSECLQIHRAAKMGHIFTDPNDEMYKIKDVNGLDIFGQPLSKKKQLNCTCPQCGRNIAASRLAPHLEKCMGMGRLSARAASTKRDAIQ